MRLHHAKHAGSLMSHGPPTGHFSHTVSKRLATNKLPGKTSSPDHVDILQTAAAPVTFGTALVDPVTFTFGHRSGPVQVRAIA